MRDLGIRISLVTRVFFAAMMLVPALATALVYGVGGHLVISETLTVGTVLALAHPAAAPARSAPEPLQRAHRRDDRTGQLRPRLRGARPALADRGAAGRRRPAGRGGAAGVRRRLVPLPAGRRDLARVARVGRAHRLQRHRRGAPRRLVRRRARPDRRARRALGRRQDHRHAPGGPALRRRRRARSGSAAATSATSRSSRSRTSSAT